MGNDLIAAGLGNELVEMGICSGIGFTMFNQGFHGQCLLLDKRSF